MKIINTEKNLIKMWLHTIEDGALEQVKNIANLPFVFKHIAIMSDCHRGYGMPIGGVAALNGVISPNMVGYDIGCGMCAVKTSLTEIDKETIKKIFGGSKEYKGGIRACVPVGFSHHSKKQLDMFMPRTTSYPGGVSIIIHQYESALKQLGTLGGGNHFIEIQKGDDGYIWIMIHSGSRNLGYKVAKHYNSLAQEMCKKWYSDIPAFKGQDGLAFLPVNTEEGQAYLSEMNYCVEFAFANRSLMMDRIMSCFYEVVNSIKFEPIINIAHNYASLENHFGQNVWVHRKGATLARKGIIGIIPGSQGTASYIVEGLGNPESFMSCSHGAGRLMSRTKAKNTLNLEEEISRLDEQGIIHNIRNKNDLDEASSAYKNIDTVMANQCDLVKILVKLQPLAVVKG